MFEISNAGNFGNISTKLSKFPKLALWDTAPEGIITDLRQTAQEFWITSSDYGAICINCQEKTISTFPKLAVDFSQFMYFFIHNWLPLAYQICGTQVVHASAVVHNRNRQVIIFCGESEAGKSTLAFGIAQRQEWSQLADDRIAFEVNDGIATPLFIPDSVRLRPPSAQFFEEEPFGYTSIAWDDKELEFSSVFFLDQKEVPDLEKEHEFSIHQISNADAYQLLLKQAFSLTPVLSEVNQKIIKDYLVIANQIKAYKINFHKNFNLLDGIFNAIEEINI